MFNKSDAQEQVLQVPLWFRHVSHSVAHVRNCLNLHFAYKPWFSQFAHVYWDIPHVPVHTIVFAVTAVLAFTKLEVWPKQAHIGVECNMCTLEGTYVQSSSWDVDIRQTKRWGPSGWHSRWRWEARPTMAPCQSPALWTQQPDSRKGGRMGGRGAGRERGEEKRWFWEKMAAGATIPLPQSRQKQTDRHKHTQTGKHKQNKNRRVQKGGGRGHLELWLLLVKLFC